MSPSNRLVILLQIRKIVRSIRSSPQKRQKWIDEIRSFNATLHTGISPLKELMLILDVKTRWSSTHSMLRAPILLL
jgi:hypothetical protein